jgi:hypothetical protein
VYEDLACWALSPEGNVESAMDWALIIGLLRPAAFNIFLL